MPPFRFNQHLADAQRASIDNVSEVKRGEESGSIRFRYHHVSLAEPAVIQMISSDCMAYPDNLDFLIFSEQDFAEADLAKCLEAVRKRRNWTNITEAIQQLAQAITAAVEHREDEGSVPEESDEMSWEGSQYEELEPLEFASNDGDHEQEGFSQSGHSSLLMSPEARSHLRKSLKRAQDHGIVVGIYPRPGSNIPEVISLSTHASCLGVAAGVLETWGLRDTDNLVLLIRSTVPHPSLDDFLRTEGRQTDLQFRFGRCLGEKPSSVSVESAYRDARPFAENMKGARNTPEEEQQPFELTKMSNSLDKLLKSSFSRLLSLRRSKNLSWPTAQHVLSQLERLAAHGQQNATPEQVYSAGQGQEGLRSLIGPLSRDAAMDDPETFSLPLVAMQLALHRLANCTHYCMVCNSIIKQTLQALKPYVCSNSLCLYQYLRLGLGSSIEHEIINGPYVVDMLVSFLYSALANSTARELPDGLGIETAYVDDDWAKTSHATALVNMETMKLRIVPQSALQSQNPGACRAEKLGEGDRILLIRRQPAESPGCYVDTYTKSWCRLISFVDGEWTFEQFNSVESTRPAQPPVPYLTRPTGAPPIDVPTGWDAVLLFGYWQKIDELALEKRRLALLSIIDGLPSILEMRQYLMDQPGRRLATWNRINVSERYVLNWTVASNRSLIVQDDAVPLSPSPGSLPVLQAEQEQAKHWSKIDLPEDVYGRWMQFRFMQGSPERDHVFEKTVKQLKLHTKTPTIFAWHGSRLKNWHSIIRTDLDFSVIENGRARLYRFSSLYPIYFIISAFLQSPSTICVAKYFPKTARFAEA